MPILENRLTWSKSRAEVFGHCLRKYWWTYYGAWGGWSLDAPGETREAYVLKNLHSRWTWVGDAVHASIEGILRGIARAADRRELDLERGGEVDVDAEAERLTERMRRQYRESRDGRYRADPKRAFGLVEHEYTVPIADAEWREMNRRAVDGLRGFLGSPTFADIRASSPATWLPFEELDSFDFEGTPVWAALDFARRTPDGGAEVYDWKTGEERFEANTLQILAYAMYVEARHAVPATRVVGRLVYVNTGTVHEIRPTERDLDEARATMRKSVAEMRQRLQMGGGPEPSKLAFPMTDDMDKCAVCHFRRLCNR
ncbi:MAG TPA: PD-(D/E)XK nuclease family protein [Planctomycetota bacterium]|nr:PD-(D/E)XK nuclease family protein [Planctomycetota bacterium]